MRNRRGHHNSQGQCPENQVRCCCGKLLAKQIDNGIVLKCTRCKREIIIRFSGPEPVDGPVAVQNSVIRQKRLRSE